MKVPPEYKDDVAALPAALRALLEAELAAGNSIAEVGHSHPAPPVGAYVLLGHRVTTRARASTNGLDFYERQGSHHSGEFTDAKRHFFILEPPLPPEPEPDMDAIRASLEQRQREADKRRQEEIADEVQRARSRSPRRHAHSAVDRVPTTPDRSVVARFRASMELDYERWREGTSYDLTLIDEANPEDRTAIEALLVGHGVRDWRDVEALARMNSPKARALLRDTLLHGSAEFAAAVARYAPDLVDENEKGATLVRALEETDFYGGLTQALMQVESFHPPAVIDALLRGVLRRTGGAQVHFAAMLLFLHGKAASSFDWDHRPWFLQFNTTDPRERERLFRELCARIGVDGQPYLGRS